MNGQPVQHRGVVQMIATGETRDPRTTDDVTANDLLPFLDLDAREVSVQREEAVAVVDEDRVAVDAEVTRQHDDAVVGGLDLGPARRGQVVAQVVLLVHLLPVVDVVPAVGEVGRHLRVAHLQKALAPQEFGHGLSGQLDQRRGILPTQLAVDGQVVVQQVAAVFDARRLVHDRRHHAFHEAVGDIDRVGLERSLAEAIDETRARPVFDVVDGNELDLGDA